MVVLSFMIKAPVKNLDKFLSICSVSVSLNNSIAGLIAFIFPIFPANMSL